jgi:rhodanese-related sulfurtransferase
MSIMLNPFRALAWRLVKRLVHCQFPQVQQISTKTLVTWLERDSSPLVLIDARQEKEYAVSHLPGARHLPTVEAIQQSDISPDTPLILYCSVGYRSARLAKQLQSVGFTAVMNLEGSIFEWYNQGHPVVVDQKPVQQVHPYNRIWGLLLQPSK